MEEIGRVRQRRLAHPTKALADVIFLLAASVLLGAPGVGGKVEGNEQEQVRAENDDAGEGSKLLARALARVGQRRKVRRGEVRPRREVDEACRDERSENQQYRVRRCRGRRSYLDR